jgi:hypothetical protein
MISLDDRFKEILAHYPEISANWLTSGKGPMFLNSAQRTENSMEDMEYKMKAYRKLMEDQVWENMKLRELFGAGKGQ